MNNTIYISSPPWICYCIWGYIHSQVWVVQFYILTREWFVVETLLGAQLQHQPPVSLTMLGTFTTTPCFRWPKHGLMGNHNLWLFGSGGLHSEHWVLNPCIFGTNTNHSIPMFTSSSQFQLLISTQPTMVNSQSRTKVQCLSTWLGWWIDCCMESTLGDLCLLVPLPSSSFCLRRWQPWQLQQVVVEF